MDWKGFIELYRQPLFTLSKTPVSLETLFQFAVMIVLVLLLARFVRRILLKRVLARSKLDGGVQEAIARIIGYIVLALGFVIGLSTMGIDLTSLTVLAGALGVGIGFGLQNIISNFVSGLIILSERPIQVGHRIEVGNTAGRVVHIGARSSTIITNDNIAIIVPNSEFISGRVTNWSYGGDRSVRFKLPVGVSYGSDPRKVEKLLLEVAAEIEDVLKDPAPAVVFKGFGDSSLDFELRVWTDSMPDRPSAFKSPLYFAIWDKFKKAGVEIPFPQRDLHLKEPLQVEVKQK